MRLIAVAVLAILFLAAPGVARAQDTPTGVCATSEDQFTEAAVRVNKARILVASDAARDTILAKINEARKTAGLWLLEADKVSIGIISHEGRMYVGIAMFKDRCVVPGTVKLFPAEQWIAFVTEIGLSMDDFAPERGA
jgi:hypothetical protein